MPEKRRNAQAQAAWSRHQGSHSPGTKRPDVDETEEQLEEYFDCPICVERSSCTHEEEIEDDK